MFFSFAQRDCILHIGPLLCYHHTWLQKQKYYWVFWTNESSVTIMQAQFHPRYLEFQQRGVGIAKEDLPAHRCSAETAHGLQGEGVPGHRRH